MKASRSGFTIVELLIVIVVIAILATISIVAYTGIQNRANDTVIQADLNSFSKRIAQFKVLNDRYPINATELATIGMKVSKGAYDTTRLLNFSYCIIPGGSGYAIGSISKSGKRFFVSSQSGVAEYSNSTLNDGNESVANSSCGDLLASTLRLSAGYLSTDPANGGWRSWTDT